jgi:hypothetical protein
MWPIISPYIFSLIMEDDIHYGNFIKYKYTFFN